jgi:predicted MFS family arabinose efflux permease
MITTDSLRGRMALMVAHCAGMVDLVALPLWVGALMGHYHLDPQQAGGLATLFLLGAVLASTVLAPRFNRLPRRSVVVAGFSLAALAFLGVSMRTDFASMAVLHALGGVAAGAGLSVTHGTIARSVNPHRLFAIVGTALGVFSVGFFAVVPPLLASHGGGAMFQVFAGVMGFAALTSLLAFPQAEGGAAQAAAGTPAGGRPEPLSRVVWFGIVGIACMGLVQAMTFSFVERVGHARGFEVAAIASMFVALSIVNLFPTALAGLLERRLQARSVMLVGPALQALLTAGIMLSMGFNTYAAAALFLPAVMLFTHNFAFGLLARIEPSGRALAATPAMLLTGGALGPGRGGTLVKTFGYGSLAVAAAIIAALAILCFTRLPAQALLATRRQFA